MIIYEMDLFDGATDEVEEEIVQVMEDESYDPGDVIIQEGDPADNFYVLRSGALNVKVVGATKTTRGHKSRRGRRVVQLGGTRHLYRLSRVRRAEQGVEDQQG